MSLSGSWLNRLHKDLLTTQRHAFASGTVRNFQSQWKKFIQFSKLADVEFLPVSVGTLCLYIQFLSRSLRAPQSIANYVSGLKFAHLLLDLPFPDTSAIEIRLTFKGLKRSMTHIPVQASPITPHILLQFYSLLDLTRPIHVVYWSLFLFMFFLFSRKSQFLPDYLNPSQLSRLVKRQDVKLVRGFLVVTFRWTKTRPTGSQPLSIPLSPIVGSPLCPVKAYALMLSMVPAEPQSPAFVLPVSQGLGPIMYRDFHSVLRLLVSKLGLVPSEFSSHSFRRGGATFAYSLGIRGELIQSQGDWASDCYKLYLNLDFPHRVSVAKCMARHLSCV